MFDLAELGPVVYNWELLGYCDGNKIQYSGSRAALKCLCASVNPKCCSVTSRYKQNFQFMLLYTATVILKFKYALYGSTQLESFIYLVQ